jgi:hypothetical protein
MYGNDATVKAVDRQFNIGPFDGSKTHADAAANRDVPQSRSCLARVANEFIFLTLL